MFSKLFMHTIVATLFPEDCFFSQETADMLRAIIDSIYINLFGGSKFINGIILN